MLFLNCIPPRYCIKIYCCVSAVKIYCICVVQWLALRLLFAVLRGKPIWVTKYNVYQSLDSLTLFTVYCIVYLLIHNTINCKYLSEGPGLFHAEYLLMMNSSPYVRRSWVFVCLFVFAYKAFCVVNVG